MEQMTKEHTTTGGARVKSGGAAPVIIALALTAAIMAGAYAGLCAWAGSRTTFYPKETISGVPVGGLTVEEELRRVYRRTGNYGHGFYFLRIRNHQPLRF